jgi:hypothetical protein
VPAKELYSAVFFRYGSGVQGIWNASRKRFFSVIAALNVPCALAIFHDLTHHGYDVFFDFQGIASGDFESVILGNITARAHFQVLLTPSALGRSNDPSDWLRREIETAIDSQRNIVPLMLEGFDFGKPKIAGQLRGKLAALRYYNGPSIPAEYFDAAMERLRDKYLNVPLAAVLHPASRSAQQAAKEQTTAAHAAPAVQEEELTAQQWFERGFAAVDLDEKLRFYSGAIRLKRDYAEAFYNQGPYASREGRLGRRVAGLQRSDQAQAGRCGRLLQPGPGALQQKRLGGRVAGSQRGDPAQARLCQRHHQPGSCALQEKRLGRRVAGLQRGDPARVQMVIFAGC